MKRRSMKRVNLKKENKTFKTLADATIAGLSFIGVGQAQAATLDEVDLSQKPIDMPTLDYLHNNDVQIKYEDGTEVAIPQSSYTMTEVKANEDGSKPAGDNIITKYGYDKTTGSLSPLYYEINHQTQFGNPDGDTTLTFGKVYGSWKLNPENPTSTITYKYNQGETIDGSITNDSTSANIARDFVNNTNWTLILNNENATINNITGNFIANGLSSSNGKLINNKGHIDNIKGTFAINKTYNAVINNNEKSTINKIESGINDITQSKIIQFAKALDTTPSYLMGWHQDYIVSLTPNTSTYIEMQQCNNQDRNQRLFHYASLLDKLNDEQLDIVYKIICQMLPQSPTEDSFHMNQTPK